MVADGDHCRGEASGRGRTVSATALPTAQVLRDLEVPEGGLSSEEAARRLKRWGPNAVHSHQARAWPVLWHQLRSPLLGLLLAAAVVSYFVGECSDAAIIAVIVALSVGLGFVNEFRAGKDRPVAAREDPAPRGRATRRAAPRGGGGSGRCGRAAARRHRARRSTAASDSRPRVQRVGADRRVVAGREGHRPFLAPHLRDPPESCIRPPCDSAFFRPVGFLRRRRSR